MGVAHLPVCVCRSAIQDDATNVKVTSEHFEHKLSSSNPQADCAIFDEIHLQLLFQCVFVAVELDFDPASFVLEKEKEKRLFVRENET